MIDDFSCQKKSAFVLLDTHMLLSSLPFYFFPPKVWTHEEIKSLQEAVVSEKKKKKKKIPHYQSISGY
jgi:hypothetical protein